MPVSSYSISGAQGQTQRPQTAWNPPHDRKLNLLLSVMRHKVCGRPLVRARVLGTFMARFPPQSRNLHVGSSCIHVRVARELSLLACCCLLPVCFLASWIGSRFLSEGETGCVSICMVLCKTRSAAAPLGRLQTSSTSSLCNTGSECEGACCPSFERLSHILVRTLVRPPSRAWLRCPPAPANP